MKAAGNSSMKRGRVCVTGGTGFLGSWMVKTLLQRGYHVNTTARLHPEGKRDITYLTSLPGASDRLRIFSADLDRPEAFAAAIDGCAGVFHVATPLDFEEKEPEEVKIRRVTSGTRAILQACVDAGTVRRVVYTSTIGTAVFNGGVFSGDGGPVDEGSWSDLEFLRAVKPFGAAYMATKTVTEKLALEFGEKNGLDVVTVLPSWIHGPFICPRCPDSVQISMALILGDEKYYERLVNTWLVHVDDVVRAHIHLFEYPNAKGRYICSATNTNIHQLHQFLAVTYPQLKLPTAESLKHFKPFAFRAISSNKLLETGFEYEKGLKEMYDGAITSCKEIGLL
ncbi:NAD(P)-binding Rossmann-fold superfamily protein [Striga asiatica]|uniref:Dihydroflavonol 4-reductase n=1 Tax=Striga asiatica TaxID=4170 RepID=A0A5A7QM32_STRAF|nr:NAD(P)-binding Rossmann-fold superfamily protein [Striga asiatica]